MPIRYLSGLSVDSTVLVVDAANDRVGIGTASPDFKLHLVGGSQYINGGQGGVSNASPYTSANRLIFNNDYNDIARGPNKITLYDGSWLGGFGVHDNTLAYYSGGIHNWYQATTATNAVSLMTLTSTGSLGIGTTAPTWKLQAESSSSTVAMFRSSDSNTIVGIDNSAADGDPQLKFYINDIGTFTIGVDDSDSDKFKIGTSDLTTNTRLTIDGSGNVGIGTTSPVSLLNLNNGDAFINVVSALRGLQFGYAGPSHGSYRAAVMGGAESYGGSDSGMLTFHTQNGYVVSAIPPERMRITSAGNVGIGTATPSVELAIYQSSTPRLHLQNSTSGTTSTDGFQVALSGVDGYLWNWENGTTIFGTNNAERMRITAAGNVGIGTTAPSSILHVDGTDPYVRINNVNSANNQGIKISYNYSDTHGFHLSYNANAAGAYIDNTYPITSGQPWGDIYFRQNNGTGTMLTRMTIKADGGNVGIGTTAPGALLQVGQASTDTDALIRLSVAYTGSTPRGGIVWHDTANVTGKIHTEYNGTTMTSMVFGSLYNSGYNSNPLMFIRGDGNVGIGTTSPAYKLDVAGTGAFSGNVAINGTFIGTDQTFGGAYRTFAFGVNSNGYNRIFAANDATDGLYLNAATGQGINFRVNGGGANVLVVASTGAATFSSSVTAVNYSSTIANKATLATASGAINVPYTTSNINEFQTIGFSYPSSVDNVTRWGMAMTATNYAAGLADLIFFTAATERLRINNAGAATFSSSVTASSLIKSGGTSSQYLMADGSVSTLTNPVTGTGTTNYVPKWTSGSAIGNSALQEVSGNLGLGVTPSAWQTDVKAIQIGDVGSNICANNGAYSGGNNVWINNNSFQNSSVQDIYTRTATAGQYNIQGNTHIWRIAPSGTAGNAITFTQAMTLDASGNLGIGTTSPSAKLSVNGIIESLTDGLSEGGQLTLRVQSGGTRKWNIDNYGTAALLRFFTEDDTTSGGGAVKMVITESGNVGIGTTAPANTLDIATPTATLRLQSTTGTNTVFAKLENTAGTFYIGRDNSVGTAFGFANAAILYESGANPMVFVTNSSERLRITSAGNVGIGTSVPANKLVVTSDASPTSENSYSIAAASASDPAYKTVIGYDFTNDIGLIAAVRTGIGWRNISMPQGSLGLGNIAPTEKLHVTGNIRVTGAYYDSSNSAGSSGQVLSSTGSGTAWVNQGEATATSIFDLLPSARTTYAWSVQLTAGTWADIFSSTTVLSSGTWMVQVYVDDFAVGGQQYQETYSGIMSWGSANSTNQSGNQAVSEIVLHRSGHAANSGNFYLRTVERTTSTLVLQGMSNITYTAASTINFKFVKVF